MLLNHQTPIAPYWHTLTPTLLLLVFLSLPIPKAYSQPTPAQLDRIAKLVEEGKTDAAKATVETLLEVHPGDAQLLAIQKLLAATPAAVPSTPAPPPKPTLSPAERLEIDTVLDAARAAFQADDAARKSRLESLLRRPVPPAGQTGGPDWLPYWQTRAAAALETSTWRAGWQAGRNLLRLNAINSTDPLLRRTLTSLNERGWLAETEAEIINAATQKYAHWLGHWALNNRIHKMNTGDVSTDTITLEVKLNSILKPEIELRATQLVTVYYKTKPTEYRQTTLNITQNKSELIYKGFHDSPSYTLRVNEIKIDTASIQIFMESTAGVPTGNRLENPITIHLRDSRSAVLRGVNFFVNQMPITLVRN